jgi:Sulfotransferase family
MRPDRVRRAAGTPSVRAVGRPATPSARPLQSGAVTWQQRLNRALAATTGFEIRRAGSPPRRRRRGRRTPAVRGPVVEPRLVTAPTFILCTLRSGSTLLRVLLNSHSQIHAPHELHLRYVSVKLANTWADRAMREMGLDARRAQYVLWDRLLHRELAGSGGKRLIVDKTPNNVFIADRLRECWPDARFIFLLRHPAAIARSRKALRPQADDENNVDLTLRYCQALERARQTYEGPTVRYEELAADPEPTLRRLCAFLGVPWEPGMLEYGRFEHGPYRAGLGDWADKIKTGAVQPPDPPPALDEIPERLRAMCATWGYLPAGEAAPPPAATAAAEPAPRA